MGFLEVGTPLKWEDSLQFAAYIREHGIAQFLAIFNRVKHRRNDALKWGDELEYHLIEVPERPSAGGEEVPVRLSLTAPEALALLEAQDAAYALPVPCAWRPEYGSWMVEATPGVPYGGGTSDLRGVELSLAVRRARIAAAAAAVNGPGKRVLPFSCVAFPLMGATGVAFTSPPLPPGGPFSRSSLVPDAVISPHPRFGTLTANIRRRRGARVNVTVPLFIDAATDLAAAAAELYAPFATASSAASTQGPEEAAGNDNEATAATRFALGATQAEAGLPSSSSLSAALAALPSDPAAAAGFSGPPVLGVIPMDAMAFGMGCCCLQVTFQARDLAESRVLYDQLGVLSPLLLALTANAPVWRGYLADTDTRWHVIAASVDCRTPAERGARDAQGWEGDAPAVRGVAVPVVGAGGPAGGTATAAGGAAPPAWQATPAAASAAGGGGVTPLSKSRYSSIDAFISCSPALVPGTHNDVPLQQDAAALATLREAGVDERLARHIAHLFTRDPLVVYSDKVTLDDASRSDHFESLQSTNWRSMRWKPPPPDAADMGWRVEARTLEAQWTDFENAAFTVLVVLLSRVTLFFGLNFYVPLSLVDANFEEAARRDAAVKGRFWFRRHVGPASPPPCASAAAAASGSGGAAVAAAACPPAGCDADAAIARLSLAEIFSGGEGFPGLLALVEAYLDIIGCDDDTRAAIAPYLRLVEGRARGTIPTGAAWQRSFIRSHPAYAGDSRVPPVIVNDMLRHVSAIAEGRLSGAELVGPDAPPPILLPPDVLPPLPVPAGGSHGGGSSPVPVAPTPAFSALLASGGRVPLVSEGGSEGAAATMTPAAAPAAPPSPLVPSQPPAAAVPSPAMSRSSSLVSLSTAAARVAAVAAVVGCCPSPPAASVAAPSGEAAAAASSTRASTLGLSLSPLTTTATAATGTSPVTAAAAAPSSGSPSQPQGAAGGTSGSNDSGAGTPLSPGVRLRGSSFSAELRASPCAVVKSLAASLGVPLSSGSGPTSADASGGCGEHPLEL